MASVRQTWATLDQKAKQDRSSQACKKEGREERKEEGWGEKNNRRKGRKRKGGRGKRRKREEKGRSGREMMRLSAHWAKSTVLSAVRHRGRSPRNF